MTRQGEEMPNSRLKERDVVLLRTVKLDNYDRTRDRLLHQRQVSPACLRLARLGYTWRYLNHVAKPRRLM